MVKLIEDGLIITKMAIYGSREHIKMVSKWVYGLRTIIMGKNGLKVIIKIMKEVENGSSSIMMEQFVKS